MKLLEKPSTSATRSRMPLRTNSGGFRSKAPLGYRAHWTDLEAATAGSVGEYFFDSVSDDEEDYCDPWVVSGMPELQWLLFDENSSVSSYFPSAKEILTGILSNEGLHPTRIVPTGESMVFEFIGPTKVAIDVYPDGDLVVIVRNENGGDYYDSNLLSGKFIVDTLRHAGF